MPTPSNIGGCGSVKVKGFEPDWSPCFGFVGFDAEIDRSRYYQSANLREMPQGIDGKGFQEYALRITLVYMRKGLNLDWSPRLSTLWD